jgi:hypothetical protein
MAGLVSDIDNPARRLIIKAGALAGAALRLRASLEGLKGDAILDCDIMLSSLRSDGQASQNIVAAPCDFISQPLPAGSAGPPVSGQFASAVAAALGLVNCGLFSIRRHPSSQASPVWDGETDGDRHKALELTLLAITTA